MNPAVLTAVAPVLPRIINLLIKAGLVTGAYFLINKYLTEARRQKQYDKFSTDPMVKAALEIKQGVNPSGTSWLQSVDGTNKDAIDRAATSVTNYSDVIAAYKKLGFGDLDADLRSELNNEDYQRFLTAVKKEGAGIVIESPYKYKVGETLVKKLDTDTPVMSVISNRKENIEETLKGSDNDKSQMLVIGRGKLTLTNIDGSKQIDNFYKVRFNYKGWFSDKIIEGWINEKYLNPYRSKSVLDKKGIPFKYSIGETIYKKSGEVRLKDEPTIEDSIFDSVLNNSDNDLKLKVIAQDRVLYKDPVKGELLANWYKIQFDKQLLFLPTQTQKWVSGEDLNNFQSA